MDSVVESFVMKKHIIKLSGGVAFTGSHEVHFGVSPQKIRSDRNPNNKAIKSGRLLPCTLSNL